VITPRDWEQVRDLFHQAMQRPAEDRAAFVRNHAGSAQVLREVESLLAAQPEAEGFLSTPAYPLEPPRAVPRLPEQSRLGHFEILGLLGAGGMGEVYRARDTRLDRTVALKVLSRDQATHPRGRERFEREARVISKLTHPHVCTLHDVGVATVAGVETQFLVMELVDGETVAARLQRGPLPVDQAIKTGIEILDALSAAHAAGIIHRDLKPGNIMLTKSGVKLLDFGLARLRLPAVADHAAATDATDPLTVEGSIVGTVPYMSPEQLRGQEADARSDVFAFGAVLYEMVTGSRAFQGDSQADLIAAILERDPPALETRAPQLPPALGRIVAACLEKGSGRSMAASARRPARADLAARRTRSTSDARGSRPSNGAAAVDVGRGSGRRRSGRAGNCSLAPGRAVSDPRQFSNRAAKGNDAAALQRSTGDRARRHAARFRCSVDRWTQTTLGAPVR
jgi:serine/threonine protein kinase